MKFREIIDHKLRQYNYRRKRNNPGCKRNNDFDIDLFLDEVDSYVVEIVEGIDGFLTKKKR